MINEAGVPGELAPEPRLVVSSVDTVTPGALLRSAREAQGLHIAALAVALKIPVRKLEALEADRFDLLHDTVFVRALALSVCRALKMEAGPVMAALPHLQAPAIRTDEVGLNARFKPPGSGFKVTSLLQGLSPVVFVALALVLAIVVILLWPTKDARDGVAQSASLAESPRAAASSHTAAVAEMLQDAASQAVNVSGIPIAAAPAMPARASDAAVAGTVALASSVVAVVLPVPGSILTLQARGQSWIEVNDAQGNSQLRKLVVAGEVLQVSGALPLSVVLGRADMVAVLVRGKPFDVASVSKDNVARFEVK